MIPVSSFVKNYHPVNQNAEETQQSLRVKTQVMSDDESDGVFNDGIESNSQSYDSGSDVMSKVPIN